MCGEDVECAVVVAQCGSPDPGSGAFSGVEKGKLGGAGEGVGYQLPGTQVFACVYCWIDWLAIVYYCLSGVR